MHLTLLGISKLVLGLWMSEARANGTHSNLHANSSLIETRIKQIETPSEIRRQPRGLDDRKHWKGTSLIHNFHIAICGYILYVYELIQHQNTDHGLCFMPYQ